MTARSLPLTKLMGAERRLDKVWYLTRINLFAGIGESEMQRVAERATMLAVVKVLAERLRVAEEEIADLAFQDVPGRLASLLLRLGEAYGERDGGGLRLTLRLTHQDIASMIGATRETVTSTLSRFRDAGLIATEHRSIVIKNAEGLRRLTQQRS